MSNPPTPDTWSTLITTAGLIVVAWIGNRKLNGIRDDARTAAEQTANQHADAEYPNLRDELTAAREHLGTLAQTVGEIAAKGDETAAAARSAQAAAERASEYTADVDASVKALGRGMVRRVGLADQAVEELRAEIPGLVADAIRTHRQHDHHPQPPEGGSTT